jgi:hypothetical protein
VALDSGEFSLLDRTLPYARRIETGANVLASATPARSEWQDLLWGPARADFGWGVDSDFDGIPDDIEALLGTQPYYYDSDGDGSRDAIEWMSRYDPLNPDSVPTLAPVMRVLGYVADNSDTLRVFVSLFPFEFLDSIQVFVGSPELLPSAGGTMEYGIFDFTPLLLSTITSVTQAYQAGYLTVLTFTFELPMDVVDALQPLSVGLSASLAGQPLVDQITMIAGG